MNWTSRYFAHYWQKETYHWVSQGLRGDPFEHTAGNLFQKRRVQPGDFIYAWSFSDRHLYLIARMQVGQYVSQEKADELYKKKHREWRAWEANDHIFAKEGTATPRHFNRIVPLEVIRQLEFVVSEGKHRSPKFVALDQVDPQTFRGLRELTSASATLLNRLIEGRPSLGT